MAMFISTWPWTDMSSTSYLLSSDHIALNSHKLKGFLCARPLSLCLFYFFPCYGENLSERSDVACWAVGDRKADAHQRSRFCMASVSLFNPRGSDSCSFSSWLVLTTGEAPKAVVGLVSGWVSNDLGGVPVSSFPSQTVVVEPRNQEPCWSGQCFACTVCTHTLPMGIGRLIKLKSCAKKH